MAVIPEVAGSPTGTASAARAAAASDTMAVGDDVQLVVNNASGGAVTVTIPCVQTCSFGSSTPTHDSVTSVPASGTRIIGPVSRRYANAVSGYASVNYSATASVTVYAIRA